VEAGAFAAVAGLAGVPLAAAALGVAGHTPLTVITAAVSGTEADVSAGATGAACGGWGALGGAWPHASVPSKTHSSQLFRI